MKRILIYLVASLTISSVCYGAARPKGTTRFQTLSAQKAPLPSAELDNEFNTLVTAVNSLSLNQQSSEWYDPSYGATYVDSTHFTVAGDKTTTFLAGLRLKFDITGSSVYSEVVSSTYSSGPNTTSVTVKDTVLASPIIKVYYGIVKPIGQGGSVSAKVVTGYNVATDTTASTIPVRDSNGKLPGSITGDAATLGGYGPSVSGTPNSIVQRNSDGNILGTVTGGASTLNGYVQDTGTTANTIPVRDGSGNLPGNSATSTNATNHINDITGAVHGATATNTANMVVRRDASGNFSAGTITATLSGTATNSTQLNGQSSSYYGTASALSSATATANAALPASSYTAADVLSKISTVDGSGSGLDADLLDGQHGAYYQPASTAITTSNISSQTVAGLSNIATTTLSATSADIDLTSLSLADGIYELNLRGTANAAGLIRLRFNNDTTTGVYGYTVVGVTTTTSSSGIHVGYGNANTVFITLKIAITGGAYRSINGIFNNTGYVVTGNWNSTATVTSLKLLFDDSTVFNSGTVVTLRKIY